jgi:hypothetical protein
MAPLVPEISKKAACVGQKGFRRRAREGANRGGLAAHGEVTKPMGRRAGCMGGKVRGSSPRREGMLP